MKLNHKQKTIYIFAVGVLVIGNVTLFKAVKQQIDNTSEKHLQAITLDLEDDIRDRIENYSNLLHGAVGFFASHATVTEDQWHNYMEAVAIRDRYPGIRSIVYAPIVDYSQRSILEARIRQQGQPNFTIYPDTVTSQLAPTMFIDPKVRDGVTLKTGFNIFSDPARSKAVEFARDNNTLAITKKLILIGDLNGTREPGFVLYLPVYRNNAPLDTVEQRRAAITGVITAGVRAYDFMDGIVNDYYKDLDFQVFDDTNAENLQLANMLYNTGDDSILEPGYFANFSKVIDIEWPNGKWYVRYVTPPGFGLTPFEATLPFVMLIRNLLLSGAILYGLYWLMTKQNKRQNSANQSDQLVSENAIIDMMESGLIVTDPEGLIKVFNKKAEQVLGYLENDTIYKMNILNMLSDDTLQVYAKIMSKELQEKVDVNFDVLVTKSLVEGVDEQKWLMVTKDGLPLNLKVTVKPVYDQKNGLLGYQFTI